MKHSKSHEPNSVQKVVFFCLFVLILVSISLGVRLVTLIRSSTFDGDHRYTIEIKKTDKEAKIISLDPTNKKMLVLYLKGKDTLPSLELPLGLPIDVVVHHYTSADKSVVSDLSDLIMNFNVNAYDMIRLITASKSINESDTVHLSFPFPLPADEYDTKTNDLLVDSGMTTDNKTVSITNASDVSGIGSRFGQLIENAGGTVISVTSAPTTSNRTTLFYYGDKTYTTTKLERLLHIKGEQKEGKGLSDIELTLGTDQEKGGKE